MRALILILLLFPLIGFGQNVYIPDANFKNYLVNNSNININGDSEIQVSEASSFTGTISVLSLNISDLTGIEEFTNLNSLYCAYNNLTTLDLSNNTSLINLHCNNNNLTSLDVTNNPLLNNLHCFYNNLASLDVSNNVSLSSISCGNNLITSLDLSNNPSLYSMNCHYNQLECLNIKNGNNTNINFALFDADNNPNLTCIEVDDVNYSNNNWFYIDPQTSFSTDCNNDCSCDNSSMITKYVCNDYTAPDGQVYSSSGTYTAIIPNAAGCDSTITINLTIIATVPQPTVTINGTTLSTTNTADAYQWLDCDANFSMINGATGNTFTPTQSGNYALAIYINECGDTSDCLYIGFANMGELHNTPKQLIKIVDVLGRETPFKPNTPLLYIYDDGTVERKMIIKE
ncbi:MAG: hypothetical protein CL844_07045 [Crocinitomicaceae bacterium]|nr:hypothetical protein [Crocinitomicaceae bacterium]